MTTPEEQAWLSTKQGMCVICGTKIFRNVLIRRTTKGHAHAECYRRVQP